MTDVLAGVDVSKTDEFEENKEDIDIKKTKSKYMKSCSKSKKQPMKSLGKSCENSRNDVCKNTKKNDNKTKYQPCVSTSSTSVSVNQNDDYFHEDESLSRDGDESASAFESVSSFQEMKHGDMKQTGGERKESQLRPNPQSRISEREQLRRLEKTIASYSNYHTLRRISKFELTEAIDDFGLEM